MKNFTSLLVAGLFSFVLMSANAQTSPQRNCNTFELMEQVFQADPSARARYAQVQQMIEQQLRDNPQARTQAIITVPVVVHVLLPAAQQAQVTDAIIQGQLDTLNFYYGASPANSDSLRVYEPFRTTYGRSEIRFCMARRTPDGLPTTGINRIVNNTTFNGSNNPGDVIVWNPVKYLNIWVVNMGGSLLGYSYTPGTWAPGDSHQGFVNDYRAFGSGPGTGSGGYHFNEYNGGKTAVHEIGHYFNLAHTWGPNNNGNPTCTLSDFCDDTPPTAAPFFGCPTTIPVTNACSPSAPGVMWQNHMDYADDRCMILFTAQQCTRMNTALNTAPDRVGLITSDGCSPVVTVNDDSRIANILTPANNSSTACVPLTPVVTLQNVGSNNLTSAVITVVLNSVTIGTQAWSGNLAPGSSTNLTLSSVPITPAVGSNTLQIFTTLPNGNPDNNPSNDAFQVTFTRTGGVAVPVVEGFEGGAFPPAGWTLNPGANPTWQRTAPGFGSANSIKADFWNFGAGTSFNITTPFINVTGEPQINVTFDVSHGQFFTVADRLRVEASNNCGASWSIVYDKTSSTGLTTGGAANGGPYTPSLPSQWRNEPIALTGAILTGGPLQLRWVAVSSFGNNIYVDNINIDKLYPRDLAVTAISRPGGAECGPFAPVITVKNVGLETITAFDVVFGTGGPTTTVPQTITLAPGASTNITLPNVNVGSGNYTFTAATNNPSNAGGTGDNNTRNDQMTKAFVMRALVGFPLVEGFEAATFPSPGWSVVNPNNNITFIRRIPGYNSTNSAFIDNFSTDLTGQVDWVQSPAFSVLGAGNALADSLIITWDLAYQTYPGLADEFSVRASSDCGNNFTHVMFSRSGLALAGPAGSGTAAYLAPAANHWQHLRAALHVPSTLTGGHGIAAFRNLQGFGNNLFIDNINIQALFKRDLKVASVDRPRSIECSGSFTPVATVTNVGVETITAFKVSYSINNGPAQQTTVTGVSLPRDASMSVNLTPVTGLATGQHSIRVYSFDPVTSSGTGDQLAVNDTLTKGFGVTGTTTAPLTESFEGTFPPTGWAYSNPDNDQTWAKANTGKNSAGSAFMRNYVYQFEGRVDGLYSPSVTYTGVDSVHLSFDLAAATYSYPGTTGIQIDTLEVLVTKDCGNTFTSVWKKWGDALQTINDPNYPQTVEFIPASAAQWRTESIDLTDNFTPNGPVQVIFKNTNNFENNIYVDNVNLTTRTLPASLKANGYMVLPSPFANQFTIWHLTQPTSLRSASVYNAAGQMVWKQEYNGNASNQITVDLSGKPAGTYIVNLRYSDRTRDQQVKIVKLNQ